MSTSILALTLALFMVTSTLGHSQMRCAKYDMATGKCNAPIRNSAVAFEEEDNDMTNGGGVCQSPMANPISASYANGAGCPDYAPCPDPMGSIAQGENFTVMWLARNHAIAEQTPGVIALYLSPVESMNQGLDVSTSVFAQNKICEAPFISCNGQNGNFVQCYATCKMPANTVVGVHTLWWKWEWKQSSKSTVYTTCADLSITASSVSTPSPPSTPSSTPSPVPVPVPTSPVTTGMKVILPSTTGSRVVVPSTTGSRVTVPSTTGSRVVVPSTTGRKVDSPTPTAPAPAPTPSVPTTPSTPSSACILGSQVCIGSGQYQTCTNGRDANYWAPAQSCNAGTECHPSTNPLSLNKIYCY